MLFIHQSVLKRILNFFLRFSCLFQLEFTIQHNSKEHKCYHKNLFISKLCDLHWQNSHT